VASEKHDLYKLEPQTFDERLKKRGISTRYIDGKRLHAHLNLGVLYG
jgi:hypothetical protein